MLRLVIHETADTDIHTYAGYLAERSLDAGDRFYERTLETAQWLAVYPGSGHRLRLRRNAGLRVVRVRGFPNHLMIYRAHAGLLEVVRVTHWARDLPKLLRSTIKALDKEKP